MVTIKIGLEQLEHMWGNIVEPLLVSDPNGVGVLSSVPEGKCHATVPVRDRNGVASGKSVALGGRRSIEENRLKASGTCTGTDMGRELRR
ncbi:hypothetical protein C3F00_047080 [Pseudomonas sp. MWU13-2860]|nr:hypothetical protein C3F00_047080 [Pseudomonas sp. MWU13-2860]